MESSGDENGFGLFRVFEGGKKVLEDRVFAIESELVKPKGRTEKRIKAF
jgi:hypothetical protein